MEPVITTFTGKRVHLLNPDPDTLCIEDIAHHLALQNRFNGATSRPYSVAAHSLYIARHLVKPELAYQALMHDASEAYLGDVVKPLKGQLPAYCALEGDLCDVLAWKFGLPAHLDEAVHRADYLAYEIEAARLRADSPPLAGDYPELLNGGWRAMKMEFLEMFEELTRWAKDSSGAL